MRAQGCLSEIGTVGIQSRSTPSRPLRVREALGCICFRCICCYVSTCFKLLLFFNVPNIRSGFSRISSSSDRPQNPSACPTVSSTALDSLIYSHSAYSISVPTWCVRVYSARYFINPSQFRLSSLFLLFQMVLSFSSSSSFNRDFLTSSHFNSPRPLKIQPNHASNSCQW